MKEIPTTIRVVNKQISEKYEWNLGCFGWNYLEENQMSIIREEMTAHSSETFHFHSVTQQFFYIIKGKATMHMEHETFSLIQDEGIHIQPNQIHKIENTTDQKLEFLVISTPNVYGDRTQISSTQKTNL